MSPDQRKMCFAEWRKCWDAILLATDGQTPLEEKDARAKITAKAIGIAKSWGDTWTQKQIDRLLGVMWAVAQSGNLALQLRQVDQPLARSEGSVFAQTYLDAIRDAASVSGDAELVERLGSAGGRESYLNGICRRIHKCELADIEDDQWGDVLGALNHTRLHKEGKSHTHPRSPWQGRKGQQTAGTRPASAHVSSMPATNAPARTGSIVPQGEG